MGFVYRVFLFLLDRSVPAVRSIRFSLNFLKVIITAIFCLPSVLALNLPDMRCMTRRWQNFGQSVSVKQQNKYLIPRIQKHECATCQPVY